MKCWIVDKKVAYNPLEDGIDAYHAVLFHGRVRNKAIDDNNLGDTLINPLHLEKNAYELRYIFQPQRNLVIPESAKQGLVAFSNISFFPVVFNKLFFLPYKTGDLSVGPETFDEMEKWLASFKNEEALRQEIEKFYELILPTIDRLKVEYKNLQVVKFNLESWRKTELELSEEMLQAFPAIWSSEGIIFREDVFKLVKEFFSWDYFHKAQFDIGKQ
jgi:hypothetical protein